MTKPEAATQDEAPGLRWLSNPHLISLTNLYRSLLGKGALEVSEVTRRHEDEMARRFGGETTIAAPL
jgi:hypothetical protein